MPVLVILSLTLRTPPGCVAWHALGGLLAILALNPQLEVSEGAQGDVTWPLFRQGKSGSPSCCKQAFLADSVGQNTNTRRVRYHAPDCQDALREADMWRLQPVRRIH